MLKGKKYKMGKVKMRIRKLEIKDASDMLKWMHDDNVIHYMKANFKEKTIEDCKEFINSSISEENINFAVANDNDEYMGTVSLKNIKKDTCAELAIIMTQNAMGKGFSTFGIHEIIKYGFKNLNLKYIYWYVSKENIRAIKFYDKNKFPKTNIEEIIQIDDSVKKINEKDYVWYLVINNNI